MVVKCVINISMNLLKNLMSVFGLKKNSVKRTGVLKVSGVRLRNERQFSSMARLGQSPVVMAAS